MIPHTVAWCDELTDGVGQNTWHTVLTPRPVAHDELTDVAHDELTDVATRCVHSFIGQWHTSKGSSATLSQLSLHHPPAAGH